MPTPPPAETATLRNGASVVIRPIRPDDAPRLQALHARLSPESIRLRFLATHPELSAAEAARLTEVDYEQRMALVATVPAEAGPEAERIVGVARYDRLGQARPGEADAAVVVDDEYQGLGAATLLVTRLVEYARAHGVQAFVADVSAENHRMLQFIRRSGLPVEKRLEDGAWRLRIGLTPPEGTEAPDQA